MKESDKLTIEMAIKEARRLPDATVEQITEMCLASEAMRNFKSKDYPKGFPRSGAVAGRFTKALHSYPKSKEEIAMNSGFGKTLSKILSETA